MFTIFQTSNYIFKTVYNKNNIHIILVMIRECSRACRSYSVGMPCAIPLYDACITYYTGGFFSGGFLQDWNYLYDETRYRIHTIRSYPVESAH